MILQSAGPHIKSALESNPGYGLVVTGHSLGAASANLIAMELLAGDAREEYMPDEPAQIRCVALAPPPVFRPGEDTPEGIGDTISVYVNGRVRKIRVEFTCLATYSY